MAKEVITTGKTVDEAVDEALKQLGAAKDDVSIEVLEVSHKKLLGLLGGSEAKVKVTLNAVEEEEEEAEDYIPVTPRKEDQGVPADKGAPLGTAAEEYLKSIISLMGVKDFTVTARKDREALYIYIEGESLGNVIGRRGETLDALQHLVNLVNRKDESTPNRVVLDCGDYRLKREAYLDKTAKSAISRAVRYSRNVVLEPMNAYERRFVHTIVQEAEGVSSHSIGEDPYRKVVISADDAPEFTERAPRERKNSRDERRGSGRGRRPERREKHEDHPVYEHEKGQPIGRREDYVPHAKRDVSTTRTYASSAFGGTKTNDGELFSLYEKIEPKFPPRENNVDTDNGEGNN